MDIFRAVSMTGGGRPLVVFNLAENQGDVWWLRGTFHVGARNPQIVYPTPNRPRQTARGHGRTDQATTVNATWRVKGTTAAQCISRIDRFLAIVDSGRDRYLEWRPDGAPVSTFYRVLGPASYNPVYEWVQFTGGSNGPGINFEVSWPVDPNAYGPPWDVAEEWTEPNPKPNGYANEVTNPTAALDTRGQWSFTGSGGALSRDTTWPVNATSFRIIGTTTGSGSQGMQMPTSVVIPVTSGDILSGRLDYKIADRPGTATTLSWRLRYVRPDGTSSDVTPTTATISADGQTGVLSFAGQVVAAGFSGVNLLLTMAATGVDSYDFAFANIALYKSATLPAVGYADGDTDGWVWEGQPHYSRSLEALESNLTEWAVDVNTARSVARSQGALVFLGSGVSNVEFRARHVGRNTGPRVNDEVEMRVAIPIDGSTTQSLVTLSASTDAQSWLQAGIDVAGVLRCWTVAQGGAVVTTVGTSSTPTINAGSIYTLRFSRVDNRIDATLFDRDGVTSLGTAGATLTTAQVAAFRNGGDAGIRITGAILNPLARVLSWARRPNTWRIASPLDLPESLVVDRLPGTVDGLGHLCDVSIQPVTQTAAWPFGLFAWTRKVGVENLVWNGDFEKDTAGWATGGTGADPSPVVSVGGVATGTTIARTVSSLARFGTAVLRITGDGTVAFQSASFRSWKRVKSGRTYTALVWYRLQAGVATTGEIGFGYDTTDRVTPTFVLSGSWQLATVEWTPTADRESVAVSIMTSTTALAGTLDIDAVAIVEGTVPPDDLEAIIGRGAFRPFGKIHAVNDYRTNRGGTVTWTKAATPDRLSASVAGGGPAGSVWLDYALDPYLIETSEEQDDALIDVFLHGFLGSGFANPRLYAAMYPPNLTTGAAAEYLSYAQPWGALGKPLVKPSAGTHERTWYIGKIALSRDAPGRMLLRITFGWAVGSSGLFEPEYLMLAPSHSVASSPTGKQNDTAYPTLVPIAASGFEQGVRIIQSDLSGMLVGAVSGRGMTDSSLGGDPIELPAGGDALFVPWVLSGVPDDPTSDAHDDGDVAGVVVHAAVTPRHNLVVPGR